MRNEFSGTAHAVAQVQRMVGDIVYQLPPVPVPEPMVPHEVPAADPLFVDRAGALARLHDGGALSGEGDRVRIAVLSGLEGIGKTAVARRAAAAAGGRFAGGELFVDYAALRRGADGTPPVDEAVARCLQGLGVDRRAQPAALADRVAMYRTRTAGQRMLVVLDGVTEPAQVRTLVPTAPGSAVLATSATVPGELIQVDGAELLMLEPLDDDHARTILAELAGPARITAEPAAVEALLGLCGGLPLALRITGARLAQEPSLTVRELLDEISEDGDPLEAVLTAAYDALPADAQRAYRLLGAVGMPTFSAPLVAALLGGTLPQARGVLRALAELNLSTGLPGRRYRFLDVVRRHAAAQPAAGMAGALARLLEFLLAQAVFADRHVLARDRLRLFDPDQVVAGRTDPFAGPAAAETWIDEEWPNLLAVLATAARRGPGEPAWQPGEPAWQPGEPARQPGESARQPGESAWPLAEPVWQLAEVLAALTLNVRRPADLIRVCRLGLTAAGAGNRYDVRARLQALASRGHLDLGRRDLAGQSLDAALADAERSGHRVLLASVWEFRGRYLEPGDREAAAGAYRRALELNEAAGERRGAALAAFFLAGVSDGPQLAEYERLVREFRELNDERLAGRVLIRLGAEYARQGRFTEAVSTAGAAVRIFNERKAVHYEAEALLALAGIAEQAGDVAGAGRALDRVAAIYEAGGDATRAAEVRQRARPVRQRPASE